MYLIPKEYDIYPRLLPIAGNSEEDVLEQAKKELVFTSTTVVADRELSECEIDQHRGVYTQIKETEEVELLESITNAAAALEQAKSNLKELQERHISMLSEINDHVKIIHRGFVSEALIPERSLAVTVNNTKLHYTLTTSGLELAYVEPFEPNSGNLFESQEHNQTKFKAWFNVDYTPETNFEIIKAQNSEGRKCARTISTISITDYIDEDTGELISNESSSIIIKAGDIVSNKNIMMLEDHNIETIVVYAKISTQKGEEK